MKFGKYWPLWGGSGPDVGRWWIFAQVVEAHSATERFVLDNIRCVAVDVEAHIASVESYDGVRLCGCIVHEHLCFLVGVSGG